MDKLKKEEFPSNEKRFNFGLLLNRYYNLFVLILVVIVFIGGFLFLLFPRYRVVSKEIREKNTAQEEEYRSLEKYFNELAEYRATYESISKEDKEKVNSMLPISPPLEDLFTEIEALIRGRGLLLNSIAITPDIAYKPLIPTSEMNYISTSTSEVNENYIPQLGRIKFVISISGIDYKGIKGLLATLENNLRLMDLEDLNFSLDGKSATLQITTYYVR